MFSTSGGVRSARSDPPPSRCEDLLDQELKTLVEGDFKGILSQQLQLTTIKLALETKRAKDSKNINQATVEEYMKKEFDRIGSIDGSGVREKLESLYVSKQLPIDTKTLAERVKNSNYFKRPLRFKNEELSVYVLAHQELEGKKSVYNRMDSAILWYQSQIAAKSTAKPGTPESNLLQASTLAGIYSGLMTGVKKWSVSELEGRLEYLKTAVTGEFQALSKALVVRMDPKCKTEMPCFDCSTKPQNLEDRLAGFIQGTKRLLDVTPTNPPAASSQPEPTKNTDSDAVTVRIEIEKPIVAKPVDETLKNVTVAVIAPVKNLGTTVIPAATSIPTATPVSTTINTAALPKSVGASEAYTVAAPQALTTAPLKQALFEKAYQGWQKIKNTKGCGNRVMIVDFDQDKWKPRAYLVDMTTGEIILQTHTSHATKSDLNNDGIPETFSNVSESETSSVGFFKIENRDHHSNTWSKYGPAMSIQGIDGDLNSMAYSGVKNRRSGREIIVHGFPTAIGATSLGCFMFDSDTSLAEGSRGRYSNRHKPILEEVHDNMSNGDLIFAYSSKSGQDQKSQWLK